MLPVRQCILRKRRCHTDWGPPLACSKVCIRAAAFISAGQQLVLLRCPQHIFASTLAAPLHTSNTSTYTSQLVHCVA